MQAVSPFIYCLLTLFICVYESSSWFSISRFFSFISPFLAKEFLYAGEALDCLVSIQTQLGKDDGELLELLKRVLKIQEKAFGTDSEEVMETLKKVVYYLEKMGRKHERLPLQRRLSKLRTKYKQMVQF